MSQGREVSTVECSAVCSVRIASVEADLDSEKHWGLVGPGHVLSGSAHDLIRA